MYLYSARHYHCRDSHTYFIWQPYYFFGSVSFLSRGATYSTYQIHYVPIMQQNFINIA